MPDKITESERAEIAAFILRNGVKKCPDGDALHAHMGWHLVAHETYLSREKLNVLPLVFTIPDFYGSTASPVDAWKKAA